MTLAPWDEPTTTLEIEAPAPAPQPKPAKVETVEPEQIVSSDIGTAASMERSVLGGLIIANQDIATAWKAKTSFIPRAVNQLFSDDRHKTLARGLLQMADKAMHVDFHTVCMALRKAGKIDAAGGPHYVASHSLEFWDVVNCRYHIDVLVDKWREKQAVGLAEELSTSAMGSKDLNEVIASVSDRMKGLLKAESGYEVPNEDDAIDAIERLVSKDDESVASIRFYLPQLQKRTGGLRRSKQTYLLAPPGTGKTAFLLAQAVFAARALKKVSCLFLMESEKDESFIRFCQQYYGLDGRNVTAQNLSREDVEATKKALPEWTALSNRLFIFRCGPVTADELDAIMQEWKTSTGLECDFLGVDNLSAMKSPNSKHMDTEYHAVSSNAKRLAEIGFRLNCATMVLVQPPKEYYEGKQVLPRPTLGHLKGAGDMGQIAKLVIGLWYHPQDRDARPVCNGSIVIVKNNNGAESVVPTLYVQPATLHIENSPEGRRGYEDLIDRYGGFYDAVS